MLHSAPLRRHLPCSMTPASLLQGAAAPGKFIAVLRMGQHVRCKLYVSKIKGWNSPFAMPKTHQLWERLRLLREHK